MSKELKEMVIGYHFHVKNKYLWQNSWLSCWATALFTSMMHLLGNWRQQYLRKTDQTWFLDQTDYLNGKLPD